MRPLLFVCFYFFAIFGNSFLAVLKQPRNNAKIKTEVIISPEKQNILYCQKLLEINPGYFLDYPKNRDDQI